DREADARYLRAVGATLRIAVQVWADLADEPRPGAIAIRDRCSADSADRIADRADGERALDSARPQSGSDRARKVHRRARHADGAGRRPVIARRATPGSHAVGTAIDRGQCATRCRESVV